MNPERSSGGLREVYPPRGAVGRTAVVRQVEVVVVTHQLSAIPARSPCNPRLAGSWHGCCSKSIGD